MNIYVNCYVLCVICIYANNNLKNKRTLKLEHKDCKNMSSVHLVSIWESEKVAEISLKGASISKVSKYPAFQWADQLLGAFLSLAALANSCA